MASKLIPVKGGVQSVINALRAEKRTFSLSAYIDAACSQPTLCLEPRSLQLSFDQLYHVLLKDRHSFAPGGAIVDASSPQLSKHEVRRRL